MIKKFRFKLLLNLLVDEFIYKREEGGMEGNFMICYYEGILFNYLFIFLGCFYYIFVVKLG